MNSNVSSKSENLEAQIVVIGGGAGGLCAAVAAKENGAADVILLEKHGKPGGNSAMANGPFGAESPAQKRWFVDARRDELFRKHMHFYAWRDVNPRLVRAVIDKSGDTIQWLEEKGIVFELVLHSVNEAPITHHLSKGSGREIIDVLTKNFEELGGRLLCGTTAKELLTRDKDGTCGVVATTKEGKELRITASCVIIATGGYGGNKELLRKYVPNYSDTMGFDGFPNMGDGIQMAQKIGAATAGLGLFQAAPGYVYPGKVRTIAAVAQDPYPIWLNKNGERFMDEGYVYEHSRQEAAFGIISQPDARYYCIFDEAILHRFVEDGFLVRPANRILPGAVMPNWRRQLLMGKPTDLPKSLRSPTEESVKISDSWEEIARWMGVAPETLKATIDGYNSSCDTGDDLFAKNRRFLLPLRTPPYYALRCGCRYCATLGGIKINHHMEVLDHDDKPIPGIYAVGIDAGGWLGEGSMYDVQLAGLALGFPLNSGRIAGENAVQYVSGKG